MGSIVVTPSSSQPLQPGNFVECQQSEEFTSLFPEQNLDLSRPAEERERRDEKKGRQKAELRKGDKRQMGRDRKKERKGRETET